MASSADDDYNYYQSQIHFMDKLNIVELELLVHFFILNLQFMRANRLI